MWRRRSWLILYLQQTDYGSMPLRLWGCPCAGEARSSMPLAMHRARLAPRCGSRRAHLLVSARGPGVLLGEHLAPTHHFSRDVIGAAEGAWCQQPQ
jgi:hypothetical protein